MNVQDTAVIFWSSNIGDNFNVSNSKLKGHCVYGIK